jgi:hypothetical protein
MTGIVIRRVIEDDGVTDCELLANARTVSERMARNY